MISFRNAQSGFAPNVPYFPIRPKAALWLEAVISPVDRWFNRIYGSRYNPLYQSGTLAVLFLLITVATGIYQLIFYKIATPYESVAGLEAQWYAGRWIRAMHSYSGDGMIVSVAVHVLRMLMQGKTWGARVLAWLTGVGLVSILFFSAWTGFVLVWDQQGQMIAMEGAVLIDVVPIFSEPIQRSFTSSEGPAVTFFFINLLLHMVFPVALLLLVWLHTFRVARPRFLPPRRLTLATVLCMVVLSVALPLGMLPKADTLQMFGEVTVDIFYAWWLLLRGILSPPQIIGVVLGLGVLGLSVPLWWRPRKGEPIESSGVHQPLCTGCTQCYLDCPYGAIRMIDADEDRTDTDKVATVEPSLCVSCGICAGSCAPMQVGPPQRTGRDHLHNAQHYAEEVPLDERTVVVMGCAQGPLPVLEASAPPDTVFYPLHCAGAGHTSSVEHLIRKGVAGVFLVTCPERDCFYREGARWLRERIYEDREAELLDRVDKRRVLLGAYSKGEFREARGELERFRASLTNLGERPVRESTPASDPDCEPREVVNASRWAWWRA